MMSRRSMVGVAMAAALASVPPETANASRWPGDHVTYRNYTKAPRLVRDAVRQWNRATTAVRIVSARRGRWAQIRVLPHFSDSIGGALRHPTAAYPPDGRVWLGPNWKDESELDAFGVSIVAHELGHALGLRHVNNPCSLMSPVNPLVGGGRIPGSDRRMPYCEAPEPAEGRYRCGPQLQDARTLARLYRTRVLRRPNFGTCPFPRVPDPVQPLGTLIAPLDEVDMGGEEWMSVEVRNDSGVKWDGSVYLRFVDVNGQPTPYEGCGAFDEPRGGLSAETDTAPRAVARFPFRPCRAQGGKTTLLLQLVSSSGARIRTGPVFEIRLRWGSASS